MIEPSGGKRASSLVIAPFTPLPAVFGGAIRLHNLLRMLGQFSDVSLVAYRTWNATDASDSDLSLLCEHVVLVPGIPSEVSPKWKLQVRGLLDGKTFQRYAYYSSAMQTAISAELAGRHFDVVVVEQSQMGFFDTAQPGSLQVFDLQNIEAELLARRATVQSNRLRRWALKIEARRFAAAELEMCRRFDLVLAPSDRERDELRSSLGDRRVETLPNTIDPDVMRPSAASYVPNEVTFVGATQVDANRDGLVWFGESILPLIQAKRPDVHVSIVGGQPPPEVRALGQRPGVSVTGFVDDVLPYITRSAVLVVPLRSGGGTRLKILEAMSAGTPVVSTSIGAEGIDAIDGTDLVLADDPQAFADAVVGLLDDPDRRAAIARAGRRVAVDRYGWRSVGAELREILVGLGLNAS